MRRISSMPASTGRPEHQKQRLWLPYMLEARCVLAQVRFSYQKKSCSFLPGQSSSFTFLVILKCMKKSVSAKKADHRALLTAAASLATLRAAVFLCRTPLEAALSITDLAFSNAAAAAAASLASTATRTFLAAD